MKNNKTKIYLSVVGSIILTWLIFELFFYVTSLGYVSIGDSYCKFGPIPAKYASFNVSFKSDYSGQLTLIDKSGNQLSNSDYTVLVNGKTVGTSFKAPGKKLINIKIRGNSNKVAGRTFVRVKGGGPFITHYYFRHHSNPFVYYIMALITAGLFISVLWFGFLQKMFYPRFKNLNKTIIFPNHAAITVKFKGVREVVLTPAPQKQKWLDKILKGPILFKITPNLETNIRLKPTYKGKKILVVTNAGNYKSIPNPIDAHISAKIENLVSKQQIIIN